MCVFRATMGEKERKIAVIGKRCLPRFLCSREIKKVSTPARRGRDLIIGYTILASINALRVLTRRDKQLRTVWPSVENLEIFEFKFLLACSSSTPDYSVAGFATPIRETRPPFSRRPTSFLSYLLPSYLHFGISLCCTLFTNENICHVLKSLLISVEG